jgi:hypothetical protein
MICIEYVVDVERRRDVVVRERGCCVRIEYREEKETRWGSMCVSVFVARMPKLNVKAVCRPVKAANGPVKAACKPAKAANGPVRAANRPAVRSKRPANDVKRPVVGVVGAIGAAEQAKVAKVANQLVCSEKKPAKVANQLVYSEKKPAKVANQLVCPEKKPAPVLVNVFKTGGIDWETIELMSKYRAYDSRFERDWTRVGTVGLRVDTQEVGGGEPVRDIRAADGEGAAEGGNMQEEVLAVRAAARVLPRGWQCCDK